MGDFTTKAPRARRGNVVNGCEVRFAAINLLDSESKTILQ